MDVAHLPESPEFVDLDTCRSLGQKRICGLDVVDALDAARRFNSQFPLYS